MRFCLVVVLVLICYNYLVIQTIGQKYEVIVDHMEIPESRRDKLFNYGTIRVKKFNRTTYCVDGYIETLLNITDDIEVALDLYALQGNEYRGLADRKYMKNVCTESKKYKSYISKYLKAFTDLSPDYECPLLTRRLNVYNAEFSNEVLPFQPPQGEKFRINFTYSIGDEILSTYSIYYILKKLPPKLPGFDSKNGVLLV